MRKPKDAACYLRGVGWKTETQLAEITKAQESVLDALDALARITSAGFAAKSAQAWVKAELTPPRGRKGGGEWSSEQIIIARLPYSAPVLARMTGETFSPQSHEAAIRAILRLRAAIKADGAGKLLLDAVTREVADTPAGAILSPNDLRTLARAALISAKADIATKKAE